MKFNILNILIIRLMLFITGFFIGSNFVLKNCWAAQYSSWVPMEFNETARFGSPLPLFESPDSQQDRAVKLNQAIRQLTDIQEIYQFDPTILIDNGIGTPPAFDFNGVGLNKVLSLLNFYSEDKKERDFIFNQKIKQPLLSVLHDAAAASFKFPSTLRYLQDSNVTGGFQELLDIAVRDLFSDPTEGLTALSAALNGLKTNKRLTPDEDRQLRLFKNLAGFFYDLKSIQYLRTTNKSILESNPDFTEPKGRMNLLRVLQLHGEAFKMMLPSTFNLEPAMPSEGLLEDLRDKLSHLSKMKIERLFSPTSEIILVFKNVFDEVKKLDDILKAIEGQLQSARNGSPPASLWTYIKSLPSDRANVQVPSLWPGIESLFNLLAPPLAQPLAAQSYDAEIKTLAPLPDDFLENQQYFQRRKSIYDILNRKGKALINPKFYQDLLKYRAIVDEGKAEAIFNQLKSAHAEIGKLFAGGQKLQGKDKQDELTSLINRLTLELMQIDSDQSRAYEERKNIIKVEQDKQQKLKHLLEQSRPCHGFGNLSDKFEEFCDKIKEIGIVLPDCSFDWCQEPQTVLEKTFHKVHRTKLDSKPAKDALRQTRIQSLLDLIDVLRGQLGIQTTLEFESDKETHKIIIEGKAKIIADHIRTVDTRNKNLWEIQGKLYNLGSEALKATTADEIGPIRTCANEYIQDFLAHFPQDTPISQELLNTNRSAKLSQLRAFVAKQQVISDHRFNKLTLVEESLKSKINTSNIPACEFLVSAFYELLKEVNDYPELAALSDTDQVRNFFFHTDPFELDPLIVRSSKTFDSGIYLKNNIGTLAKELAILTINVKYLLEDF